MGIKFQKLSISSVLGLYKIDWSPNMSCQSGQQAAANAFISSTKPKKAKAKASAAAPGKNAGNGTAK